ncbi:MAG TPA: DUF480 domain-containing protein, partial [Pirellulales bacterium]
MNEQNSIAATESAGGSAPRWKPLGRIDRRVAGVLVEKAKTTPDQYPMTINGLINGCNQKSNRDPQMELDEGDITDSLDRLKVAGAAVEVQGSGRVLKYRHLLYEWLGVSKVELAVMAELLLRGAQTEGELRGRASRMEPIADLNAMREILNSLRGKRLVIDLTPTGRGQIISHGLYEAEELERLKQRLGSGGNETAQTPPATMRAAAFPPVSTSQHMPPPTAGVSSAKSAEEMQSLRAELSELRRELESLAEMMRRQEQTISDLRSS